MRGWFWWSGRFGESGGGKMMGGEAGFPRWMGEWFRTGEEGG